MEIATNLAASSTAGSEADRLIGIPDPPVVVDLSRAPDDVYQLSPLNPKGRISALARTAVALTVHATEFTSLQSNFMLET